MNKFPNTVPGIQTRNKSLHCIKMSTPVSHLHTHPHHSFSILHHLQPPNLYKFKTYPCILGHLIHFQITQISHPTYQLPVFHILFTSLPPPLLTTSSQTHCSYGISSLQNIRFRSTNMRVETTDQEKAPVMTHTIINTNLRGLATKESI